MKQASRLPRIFSILKRGGIVVVPTDTLYGIVASAFNKKAVERIYKLKGRDSGKPFIILISSLADLKKFSITINLRQKALLEKLWPGPVSVILPCPKQELAYLHRGTKSLAFRLIDPHYRNLHALIKKTGPLVAPSANPEGLPPAQTPGEAKRYFNTNVDAYAAGSRKNGQPSIIISLLTDKPKIIRGQAGVINDLLLS